MQRSRLRGVPGRRQPNAPVRAGLSGGVGSRSVPRFSVQRQDSHRGKQRRKPNAASEQLFNKLSDEYYIRLACDQCIVHRRDTLSSNYVIRSGLSTHGHLCTEHKLLLQSKTPVKNRDNWTLIRPRPWSYDAAGGETDNLCDYATLGRACPDGNDCVYAHSSVEADIWETVKIDLSIFIDDVRLSSLVTRSFVARFCKLYDGSFLFLCRLCFYSTQPPQLVHKKQHVVEFRCGHAGTGCSLLCFQTNDGSQTIPIVPGDAGNQTNLSHIVSECLILRNNYKITELEIEEESKRWKQLHNTSAKPKKASIDKVHKFTEEDCYAPEWYPQNVLAKHQHIKEMGIIDEYESAHSLLRCEQSTDNSGFIVRDNSKTPYYEYFTEDQLNQLLDQEPDVYRRCLISLKSGDTAECEVIGTRSDEQIIGTGSNEQFTETSSDEQIMGTSSDKQVDRIIEVRGRRNCGQCFSGDEVLVKILVHEGKEQKISLGKVVGVFKHNIDCKSQVFVCTYLASNLMIPLCGTAPTIRISDFIICKKYKNIRHDLVEVYNDRFNLRHIARLPKDTSKVVFVVRLITWNTKNALPLGRVTRILKSPETLTEELKLLNIVYQIPWLKVSDKNEKQCKKLPAVVQESTHSTTDDDFAITIDSIGTEYFDDAFTVKLTDDSTNIIIGVHITDVTERVAKGDRLDNEAAQMVENWYTSKYIPGVSPAQRLFHDVRNECSLRASSVIKCVISVFFTLNSQTGEISETRFTRFKIRIRDNLDYRQAQNIINRHYADRAFVPDNIESKVITLHQITEKMRNRRLGIAAKYFDDDKNGGLDKFADAQRLVEELSLAANRNLAAKLLEVNNYSQCLPIRRQTAPSDEARIAFKMRNERIIAASLYFAHPNWLPQDVEGNGPSTAGPLCRRETLEILQRMSAHDPRCNHLLLENCLPISDTSYDRLKARIIGTEILHPDHHLAMVSWFRLQRKAEYVCSEGVDVTERRHFQMNFPAYIQFTSPLRRHLDAVVHRILKGVLDNLGDAPYTVDEVRQMCQNANRLQRAKKGKRSYTEAVEELDFVQMTSKDSRMLTCFVVDFDDSELVLSFPAFKHRSSDFRISYRNLCVRTLPEILEPRDSERISGGHPATRQARITWEMRIYDTEKDKTGGRTKTDLMRIIDFDNGAQSYAYHIVEQPASSERTTNRTQNCITSEMSKGIPFVVQHVRFRMAFIPGMTVEVQLGKYGTTREGRRELQIDLISLPNRLHDFCILHSRHPVNCLSHITYQRSMKTFYRSLEQYRQIWLPILSMESATNAVSADTVVCRNVPLRIYSRVLRINDCYNAHLSLEKSFCEKRKLTFLLNKCRMRLSNYETEAVDDFLCIRYKYPSVKDTVEPAWKLENYPQEETAKESPKMSDSNDGKTWIAHGTVTSCSLENGMVDVKCRLTQINFRLNPDHALFGQSSECRCTVEFMPKTLTDRRRESAVRKEMMSQLCKDILLNRNLTNQRTIQGLAGGLVNRFDPLNEEQRTAIDNARKYRFYLIHGPPGTGKTVVGVHLAHCFVQSNRLGRFHDRRQVLYCGPSNSAVDVAACKLVKLLNEFSSCSVKIIRIYSQTLERRAYPVPRDLIEASSPAGETSDELLRDEPDEVRHHILHHRIRNPENPHSQEILRYDARFRENMTTPWEVTNAEIEEYEGVLRQAEALEIEAADIVFCTCISSASDRVTRNARARQIIIDESGMCAEPDCLVPLTSHPDVEQVVLVGDHLQLQPIAVNYAAKKLGLGRSLFERHSDNSRSLTMLRKQYRMHDSICRFPSEYFYRGRLVTALNPASPSLAHTGHLWPVDGQRIVFCHLEGREENQKVATADGNLFSKSNDQEQVHVIKILRHLVTRCNIPMQSIAVVSQYKAQCSQLRRKLTIEFGHVGLHVSTVVASQGKEWDYMILSTVRSLSKYEIDPHPQITWISDHLGTAADPHQINVALTRAKHGLIILGNKNLLEVCPMWKALIDDYRNKGCLLNAGQFPPSS